MVTNTYTIQINATPAKVWQALTDTEKANEWMPNVKIESDWQQGGPVTYTCYNEDGTVMQWNGKEMIWSGIISVLDEPHEYACDYTGSDTGLVKETYMLEPADDETTIVNFIQICADDEVAAAYKDGTDETMVMLKTYVEK